MEEPGTKPPANAPSAPAKPITSNTAQSDQDSAPPTVSSAPSSDTRGSAGTSTAEGPSHAKRPVPDQEASADRHPKRGGDGLHEEPPPGERVDDEATDGKVTKRQE